MAPPSITTFCPPRPVRTKERSLEERRYSREKMIPTSSSAKNAMPTRIRLSITNVVAIVCLPSKRPKKLSDQVRPRIHDRREPAAGNLLGQQHALAALKH